MERLGTYDRHRADSTLRAMLHALRDRIAPAVRFISARNCRCWLVVSITRAGTWAARPPRSRHEAAFVAQVSRELPRADEAEIKDGICAVFGARQEA
jgi:uncharacterized protein (DUF2267 family)